MAQYYGYRCYDSDGQPLGWLYSTNQETQLAFTAKNLDWCMRWKTERGAKKQFDWYAKAWQFKAGGYLKIEIMPEELPAPYEPQQRWQEKNPDVVKESKAKYDAKNPVWGIRLIEENRRWLEGRRQEKETNTELINRAIAELRKLKGESE